VRTEVHKFAETNVGWIAQVLTRTKPAASGQDLRDREMAIFAAIAGAQLIARGCQDIGIYDRTIRAYRTAGLIP
jgi:TetR/AcrR family transcriptional repressor of nem operon